MIDINNIIFRKLNKNDYENFLLLIKDFRETNFTKEQFIETLDIINLSSDIYVLEYDSKLIATGTIIYEKKFIFNLCTLAHIEDVCVKMEYRNKGLGKLILVKMINICKDKNAYKITLDCNDTNVEFYKKCSFNKKGNQMVIFTEDI